MNWRALGVGAAGIYGAYFLLAWVTQSAPGAETWFIWQYLKLWGWLLLLGTACLSAGIALVRAWLPGTTSLATFGLGFPVGVVVFVLGIYGFGAFGLLGPRFAVLWPMTLVLAGLLPLFNAFAGQRLTLSGLELLRWGFGLTMLGVIYLGVMSPDAISYDAGWNHLVIAQDYAREGRVVPYLADWNKNMPHLGSVLNSWAFMVPGLELPALKWMLALHIEFICFVGTLTGVAAAARWAAQRETAGTWAVFALFPGLFVYDNNLSGSADHFTALFGPALVLATGLAWKQPTGRSVWVVGALAGGALLSKTQGVYLAVPPVLVLMGRLVWLAARREERPALAARKVLELGGVCLLVFSPHLIGNVIVHHNPAYPFLQGLLPSTPTIPDAAMHLQYMLVDWKYRAPDTLGPRISEALELLATFSFTPHYSFVKEAPIFGQAFTLCLPWLLLLPAARRLWAAALLTLTCVFLWAAVYRVDRNLQTVVPMMMVVTAAILTRAWALGFAARVAVIALVAAQLAWGSGWYFHGSERMESALRLLRGATNGEAHKQLSNMRADYVGLGGQLPKDATVLLHNSHTALGINRKVLLDWVGFQALYDYRTFHTAKELYDRFRETGVTHVVWLPGERAARSKQEEIIFAAFIAPYESQAKAFRQLRLIALPQRAPPAEAPYQVLTLDMGGYRDGLYPVEAMSIYEDLPQEMQHYPAPPRTAANPLELLGEARAVLLSGRVKPSPEFEQALVRDFRPTTVMGGFRLFLRK